MKDKCKHPKNYGKECSLENCPEKNEWDTTNFEICMEVAEFQCEYAEINGE